MGIASKLGTIQNSNLRRITGAYKATQTSKVEAEALIPPINIYLDSLVAGYRMKSAPTQVHKEIRQACEKIRNRLRRRKGRQRRGLESRTPQELNKEWAETWTQKAHKLIEAFNNNSRAEP